MNDDLLPEHAGIDASLAAARRELAGRLAAVLDLDAGLAAILNPGEDAGRDELATATDPGTLDFFRGGLPLPGGPAAVIIAMRASARALADDLGYTRALADALDRALDLARALTIARDHARPRSTARARGRGRARDIASALVVDLTSVGARARRIAHVAREFERDRGMTLARVLAEDIARDIDLARVLAEDIARDPDPGLDEIIAAVLRPGREPNRDYGLQSSLNQVKELVEKLIRRCHAYEVDASGADLSALDLTDMSVLEGVVWSEETAWPPGVRERVELRSREIRPGIYQVGGGSERDPAELVTT